MSVATSCANITAWCREHAPATAEALNPAATPGQITAAEQRTTGTAWPQPLRELYLQFDGAVPRHASLYVHGHAAPLDDIVAEYRSLLDFWGPREDTDDLRRAVRENEPDTAGHLAAIWLPQFLPVAPDGDGGYLFVDTRPGPRSGCVRLWNNVERDGPPLWDSISSMLDDIATALTEQSEASQHYPAVSESRYLTWLS